MSNASNRNFGLAQTERERRLAMALDDPGDMTSAQAVNSDPGWQAFFGSLRQKEQDANAAGLNFRADLSGLGRPGADGMEVMPGAAQSARGQAANVALGQMADQNRARLLAEQAQRDAMQQDAVTGLQKGYAEQVDASQNAPLVDQPNISTNADGSKVTMRPSSNDPTAQALARMDPISRLKAQQALDAQKRMDDAQAEIVRHNKAVEGVQGGALISDNGIDLAAKNYLQTGQMPPLGMGDKTTRQRIITRAAEMSGGDGNIAANAADYKSDKGSLASMQKQRDAISAFENTASKNIDIFLDAAGKVVDTGSPLANSVARTVSGKALGSTDQAAYEAARTAAMSEIAKIINNPNLSGTLSDSARHEIQSFNPENATLAQSVAVMRILKQDMGNRAKSLDDGLAQIRSRIGSVGGRGTAPAATAPAPSAGGAAPLKIGRYQVEIH